jgi:hypothetical protein
MKAALAQAPLFCPVAGRRNWLDELQCPGTVPLAGWAAMPRYCTSGWMKCYTQVLYLWLDELLFPGTVPLVGWAARPRYCTFGWMSPGNVPLVGWASLPRYCTFGWMNCYAQVLYLWLDELLGPGTVPLVGWAAMPRLVNAVSPPTTSLK